MGRWLIDGFDLSTVATGVSNRAAGWQMPGKRGDNQELPGLDGAVFTPNKPAQQGQLPLKMWVLGCLPDGTFPTNVSRRMVCRDNLERLSAIFADSSALREVTRIESAGYGTVNAFTNPRSEDTVAGGAGYRNLVTNPAQRAQSPREARRNTFPDPSLTGKGALAKVAENIYPDALNKTARSATPPNVYANHWTTTSYEVPHNFDPTTSLANLWVEAASTSAAVYKYATPMKGTQALGITLTGALAAAASLGRRTPMAFTGSSISFRAKMRRKNTGTAARSVACRILWYDANDVQVGATAWTANQTVPTGLGWGDLQAHPHAGWHPDGHAVLRRVPHRGGVDVR